MESNVKLNLLPPRQTEASHLHDQQVKESLESEKNISYNQRRSSITDNLDVSYLRPADENREAPSVGGEEIRIHLPR